VIFQFFWILIWVMENAFGFGEVAGVLWLAVGEGLLGSFGAISGMLRCLLKCVISEADF